MSPYERPPGPKRPLTPREEAALDRRDLMRAQYAEAERRMRDAEERAEWEFFDSMWAADEAKRARARERRAMPTFRVTSPEGRTFEVTAPHGASIEEVIRRVQEWVQKERRR